MLRQCGGGAHPSASGVFTLRREIYWLEPPLVQCILRFLAHHHWLPNQQVVGFLMTIFCRIGDSLGVEETHRIGRGMEKREQQPDVMNCLTFYSRLMGEDTPPTRRGIRHMRVPDSSTYTQTSDNKPPVPWSRSCATSQALLPLPKGMSLDKL